MLQDRRKTVWAATIFIGLFACMTVVPFFTVYYLVYPAFIRCYFPEPPDN
jgi:hypothetical protein